MCPQGLEPGPLKHRSVALAAKQRRQMMKKHAFYNQSPKQWI